MGFTFTRALSSDCGTTEIRHIVGSQVVSVIHSGEEVAEFTIAELRALIETTRPVPESLTGQTQNAPAVQRAPKAPRSYTTSSVSKVARVRELIRGLNGAPFRAIDLYRLTQGEEINVNAILVKEAKEGRLNRVHHGTYVEVTE